MNEVKHQEIVVKFKKGSSALWLKPRTVGGRMAIRLYGHEHRWITLGKCRHIIAVYMWERRRYVHAGGGADAADDYAGTCAGLNSSWFVGVEDIRRNWTWTEPDEKIVAELRGRI